MTSLSVPRDSPGGSDPTGSRAANGVSAALAPQRSCSASASSSLRSSGVRRSTRSLAYSSSLCRSALLPTIFRAALLSFSAWRAAIVAASASTRVAIAWESAGAAGGASGATRFLGSAHLDRSTTRWVSSHHHHRLGVFHCSASVCSSSSPFMHTESPAATAMKSHTSREEPSRDM
jgi:hypothetical protein